NRGFYTFLTGLFLAVVLGLFLGVGKKFQGVFQDLFQQDPVFAKGLWIALFAVLGAAGILLTLWGLVEFKVLRAQMPQWIKLAAAGALAFLLFCLFSPWSLLDIKGFLGSMNYEWEVVARADANYTYQFKDTPHYWFHLQNLMHVEL